MLAAVTLEARVGEAPAAYVREVARRLDAMLGERLEGAWLVGSAALGDFAPGRSDLDVQALTRERLPRVERERIAAALTHEALPCPVRGLELVLYAREDLAGPDGPTFQLNLNTGPGMEHHLALHPQDDPRFWFVLDVAIARQAAIRLAGPEASAAFPDPGHALVARSLRDALAWYARHGGSAAQTVLAACRAWAWAGDGRWRSKGASARWARERLADPQPVERALRLRDGAAERALDDADVEMVLGPARAALADAARRLSAAGPPPRGARDRGRSEQDPGRS
jgi:aminoglycoside adenylyltransferase-like protein